MTKHKIDPRDANEPWTDNWEGPIIWRGKQARYSIPDMEKAIETQCKFCNQVWGGWTEANDCVSHQCPLFPFRPGIQNPVWKGIKRAIRKPVSEKQREVAREKAKKYFGTAEAEEKKSSNSASK